MIFALVLAGGRSSRFGREKAVEPFAGAPMIAWVLDALANGSARQAVNAPPASAAAAFARERGLDRLPDAAHAAAGPLAGIIAGLCWAAEGGAAWLATAPCDTPLIPRDLIARLTAGRSPGGAVARTAEGLEPLCALWPVGALQRLMDQDGHPPIRSVSSQLGAAEVLFDDVGAFDNLNTEAAFAAAEARMKAWEPPGPDSRAARCARWPEALDGPKR